MLALLSTCLSPNIKVNMEAYDTKVRPSDEKRRSSDNDNVNGIVETYTEEEERALVRKLDMVILPFVRDSNPGQTEAY